MFSITFWLILLVLFLGIKELGNAVKLYSDGRRKWAIASAIIGCFAILCGFLAAVGF